MARACLRSRQAAAEGLGRRRGDWKSSSGVGVRAGELEEHPERKETELWGHGEGVVHSAECCHEVTDQEAREVAMGTLELRLEQDLQRGRV